MKKVLVSMLVLTVLAFAGSSAIASGAATKPGSGGVLIAAASAEEEFLLTHPSNDDHGRDRAVLGTVVSINQDKREVVINDDYSHLDTPVILHADDLPKVSVGDEIKVLLSRGTNVARTVIIVEKKKPDPQD